MRRPYRVRVVRAPAVKSRLSKALDAMLILVGLGATFVMSAGITLLLASEGANPPVPDVVGLDPNQAERVLAGAGLRIAEAGAEFHDGIAAGRIVRQDPAAGLPFKRGRSVQVFLSLGRTLLMVPRLEGDSLVEAQRRLEAEGFQRGRVSEIPNDVHPQGRVIAQAPGPYAEALPGAPVSLLLSAGSGSESFLMPDFIGRRYGDLADGLSRAAVRVGEVRNVDYPGTPRGTVVDQSPRAGERVTRANRIVLTLSR